MWVRVVNGFIVSLGVGWLAAWATYRIMSSYIKKNSEQPDEPREMWSLPHITGLIERIFFTSMVAFDVSGFATAMVARTALKAVARKEYVKSPIQLEANLLTGIRLEISSLLASLVSMFFAMIGGLICREKIPLPDWWLQSYSTIIDTMWRVVQYIDFSDL